MKCFNCGDDADMKVLIMLNGKLQQVDICSDCYKEQLGEITFKTCFGNAKLFEFRQRLNEEIKKYL